MNIKDIKVEDIEKIGSIILGLATLGMQLQSIFSKYKATNPELTLEDFIAEITRIQNIPTDWSTVYPEE
jgi:hypothetical protein